MCRTGTSCKAGSSRICLCFVSGSNKAWGSDYEAVLETKRVACLWCPYQNLDFIFKPATSPQRTESSLFSSFRSNQENDFRPGFERYSNKQNKNNVSFPTGIISIWCCVETRLLMAQLFFSTEDWRLLKGIFSS